MCLIGVQNSVGVVSFLHKDNYFHATIGGFMEQRIIAFFRRRKIMSAFIFTMILIFPAFLIAEIQASGPWVDKILVTLGSNLIMFILFYIGIYIWDAVTPDDLI